MTRIETARLALRELDEGDASFIYELVNDPAWIAYIGDKGVRNLDDARAYIANGPAAMIAKLGFGLYRVALRANDTPIGLCGLLKRDTLDDVDLGFAFLPAYRGQGYGREAALAVLDLGRQRFGLERILAITSLDNDGSIRLLESMGFVLERSGRLAADAEPVNVFVQTPA
jgi:[ribosomal protein S5]-alanine N-acetyltransferase